MSCPTIVQIDKNQCIGNSLSYINSNFTNLLSGICDNIDRINILDTQITNLDNTVTGLSSIVTPGAAKAWVRFSGTQNSNNVVDNSTVLSRRIYSSYNLDIPETVGVSIYTEPDNPSVPLPGYYVIYLKPDLMGGETNYLVIGTSDSGTFVQPIMNIGSDTISTDTEVVIRTVNSSGAATPASNVSVAIF